MLNFVQKQLSAPDAEALMTNQQTTQQQFSAYYVGLSEKDTKGLRTMAEGREGYARLSEQECGEETADHGRSLSRKSPA